MLVTALLFGLTQAAAPSAPTRYEITYSASSPRMVRVVADFTATDSVLQMYGYGGEHLPDGWRTFVRNERLETRAGKPLRLERLPDRKWKAFIARGERVRLTYDVAIEHDRGRWVPDAREAAYVREWGVFAVGRALFIYDDANASNIEIRFELPVGWRVATAWRESKPGVYMADTWADAMQSTVFAGRFTSFDVVEGPVTVSYAIGGKDFARARELISTLTRDLLGSYTALFGGAPATRLFVVINPDSSAMGGGGGVFRRSISMTFSSAPDHQTIYGWGHTLAHEFFHIWNATALRRASESEEWLIEGNADYYAILTMGRLGYFPVPVVLAKFGAAFAKYERVAGSISLAQAGHQEWREPGPTMLYSGGLTAALSLDLTLRRTTANAKSLDHVMRDIYGRFGNGSRPLGNPELLATANRIGGIDLGDFFGRFVDGKDRLPAADYLSHIGVRFEKNQATLDDRITAAQATARMAYFGPRAKMDGTVPPLATQANDHNVAPVNPSGRYDVIMHRPDAEVSLDVVIAGAESRLTGIVTGTGGSIVADTVTLNGTALHVVFRAHETRVVLDFSAKGDDVEGTWAIGSNSGKLSGRRKR